MFSGPVTIMASIPAASSNRRARATRCSYSALGKADSAPCRTPALSISVVSDEVCGRGIEGDAKTGRIIRPHRAVIVRNARNGIVDQSVGAVELSKGGRGRAGNVKRGGRRGGTFIHLSDHERHIRASKLPRRVHGRGYAAELHELQMRVDLAAIAADPGDIVETCNALVQHHRDRTLRRQAIDGLPVASRHGLFDINDAKESKRLEIVERFKLGPAPVC